MVINPLEVTPGNSKPEKPPVVRFDELIGKHWESVQPIVDDFEDYVGPTAEYTRPEFERDWARAEELKKEFFARGNDSELAKRYEHCLIEAFANGGWFSENITAAPGSRYDDYCRQTDMVITIKTTNDAGESVFHHFSVDATIATDGDKLAEKESKITNRLKQGDLGEVKYFVHEPDDPDAPIEYGQRKMPKIIVRTFSYQVDELATLLVENKERNGVLAPGTTRRMEKFKMETINTILDQLERYMGLIDSELATNPPINKKKRLEQARLDYDNIRTLIGDNMVI